MTSPSAVLSRRSLLIMALRDSRSCDETRGPAPTATSLDASALETCIGSVEARRAAVCKKESIR